MNRIHQTIERIERPGATTGPGPVGGNRFTYAGREPLGDTQSFYYYRWRVLDPNTGRFTTEDPLRRKGRAHWLYHYVRNNTTLYTDPKGLIEGKPNFAVGIYDLVTESGPVLPEVCMACTTSFSDCTEACEDVAESFEPPSGGAFGTLCAVGGLGAVLGPSGAGAITAPLVFPAMVMCPTLPLPYLLSDFICAALCWANPCLFD